LLVYFDVIEIGIYFRTYATICVELALFFSILFVILLFANKVNNETSKQIIRLSEVRSLLEKLRLDWYLINEKIPVNQLTNTTYKKAKLYYQVMN